MHRRGHERRRFVRVDDMLVASVEQTGEPARDATTLNFSAGGVLLLLEDYLPAGSELDVAIRLKAPDELVRFTARVVRTRSLSDHQHEVAAEFVGGSAEAQRTLQERIAQHAPAPVGGPPKLTA